MAPSASPPGGRVLSVGRMDARTAASQSSFRFGDGTLSPLDGQVPAYCVQLTRWGCGRRRTAMAERGAGASLSLTEAVAQMMATAMIPLPAVHGGKGRSSFPRRWRTSVS